MLYDYKVIYHNINISMKFPYENNSFRYPNHFSLDEIRAIM